MRPIDADALIEYLKEMWGRWDEDDWYEAQAKDALKGDIEIVNKQPTLDVAPVVHGEFILINRRYIASDGWEYKEYKCSRCGRVTVEPDNYCPRCGAKMDGERKEGAE